MRISEKIKYLVGAYFAAALAVQAAPTIDGSITAGDGWTLATEAAYAQPYTGGGSTTTSDLVGESSSFHWWDGNNDHAFDDNRGDVINFHFASDYNFLYLAVAGPTAPFNSFNDAGGTDDQGNLYIAIDSSLGSASGQLSAQDGHNNFGTMAVDFMGWTPTHILGVQYVDNGGGGGGYADLQETGTHLTLAGEWQNQNNGGFDWHATINSSAAYDTYNGNAGEFEFRIPWTMLGLSLGGPPPGESLRFAVYVTQNMAGYDAYDSGPGLGNGGPYEQIGDNPGDPDTGGQWGPSDPGSIAGSFPGSNENTDLSLSPSHDDGVDTIQEYYSVTINAVPEPGTMALIGIGAGIAFAARRRRG